MSDIFDMTQDEVYNATTGKRIKANSSRERQNRSFGTKAQAYIWTNESLIELKTDLGLDLKERNTLLISCSGDPFATFAYLNAGDQIGFDTSHKAILWTELKLKAIEEMSWPEFCWFFGINCKKEPKTKPDYGMLQPHLSQYARKIFDTLFKNAKRASDLYSLESFFRQGYSGAFPNLNIYSTSKKNYEKARENLKEHRRRLVAGSLEDVLNLTEKKFGAFYGSNALDHFTGKSGRFDYSKENISPFIKTIDSKLEGDAIFILQFEWSQDLAKNAKSVLQGIGYNTKSASGKANGYGKLCVARKKAMEQIPAISKTEDKSKKKKNWFRRVIKK